MSNSLQPYELYPTVLLCPWYSPGKNTGVSWHALLQGIFPTEGTNLCLLFPTLVGSLQPSNKRNNTLKSHNEISVSSVQSLSHARLFPTPWTTATPGLPVHHQLPQFTQTHVHWISDAIQPSHPLLSLLIRWPKYWDFSFNSSLSSEHPGLISFRDGLVGSPCSPGDSQESSTPQFKSINSSALKISL